MTLFTMLSSSWLLSMKRLKSTWIYTIFNENYEQSFPLTFSLTTTLPPLYLSPSSKRKELNPIPQSRNRIRNPMRGSDHQNRIQVWMMIHDSRKQPDCNPRLTQIYFTRATIQYNFLVQVLRQR